MPVYEYECGAGHRFEVTQKFSDRPITACQTCAQPVSKVISAPAIMFKGSGWYVTDYSDKLKPPTSPESTAKPVDGQKEGKSETASPAAAATPPAGPSDQSGGTSSSPASAIPTPSASPSSSS